MTDAASPSPDSLPFSCLERIDRICMEFERQWQAGQQPRIEDYLQAADPDDREHLLPELLLLEWEFRGNAGQPPALEEYRQRFAADAAIVQAAWVQRGQPPEKSGISSGDLRPGHDTLAMQPQSLPAGQHAAAMPERIGRYRVLRRLGQGGFAEVYLAHDPDLGRQVALKVPRRDRFLKAADLEGFVTEARTTVKLEHLRIVRIHDVQREPGLVYIVQQYIDGQDLQTYAKSTTLTVERIVDLMLEITETVGFAHRQGFVHRDLKPSNILLDQLGQPYVADFGLALHVDEQHLHQNELAGSYPYMSPEQVRGEAHRLDGRSDIWSLGVVLYELLGGRRPFFGSDRRELIEDIESRDPRPLCEINPSIPREVARICLNCLAKRKGDRYETAADLIDDLRHWRDGKPSPVAGAASESATVAVSESSGEDGLGSVKIVPKGLRSFDAGDADFFLELLPGPHDREGLPYSIRWWRTKIEETDPDETFAVGVMYGPSGCGKSSRVKAALLPRLSGNVLPLYVEATAADTEVRLLKTLRKRCPELAVDASLPEVFAQLRNQGGSRGRKVLVVLDQFEQWLHACDDYGGSQLVRALRQCDGSGVQCLVLIRADFWMAVTRFMQTLEIPLVEGRNQAVVDLFDPDHAQKVLAAFGRAYGRLPDSAEAIAAEQRRFLDLAVQGLAEDNQVICVRLALFADMMKGRPWTGAVLGELGGAEGLRVRFLDESFTAQTAPPSHRRHEKAARAVLQELAPEQGSDIKGQMKPYQALFQASGYADRPGDFDALLTILDHELRLITPTEPDQTAAGDAADSVPTPDAKHYQLTHDYLAPSLRTWLTREKKKTRRGRAELRLAERAGLWNSKPENRHLPAWWEYLSIRCLTDRKEWKAGEQKMMARGGRFHLVRCFMLLILLSLLGWAGYEINGNVWADALVNSLRTAKEDAVLGVIDQLGPYRRWADGRLRSLSSSEPQTAEDQRAGLHARMALLPAEPRLAEDLKETLLDPATAYSYVGVLCDVLQPHRARFTGQLWEALRAVDERAERRFHAGLALAEYEPAADGWSEQDTRFLAEQLISANPEHQPRLREYLRPIGELLLAPLEVLFRNQDLSETQQLGAANALADFAAQDGQRLADLLTVATGPQYRILHDRFERLGASAGNDELLHLVQTEPADDLSSLDRVSYGRRRAGAAITLLRQGLVDQMFAALRVGVDPESLTQFVHRCRARDVSPQMLLGALDGADKVRQTKTGEVRQQEDRVLFGLLLALGEYGLEELPASVRRPIVDRLAAWYASDPSSAIHGATGWLLRHWNQVESARQVDKTPVGYSPDREWYTLAIPVNLEEGGEGDASIYFTFIMFPAGGYEIGSPEDEPEREYNEPRRRVRLTRGFALSDRPMTWRQFDAFDGGSHRTAWTRQFGRELGDDDPVFGVNWFESVAYCRWLTSQSGLLDRDQAYGPEPLEGNKDERPGWVELPDATGWPVRLGTSGYRLPTEAEWEVACRGGTLTAYSYGGDAGLLSYYGWYADNSERWSRTVGLVRPNPRGFLDMHGNVYVWCHDWYADEAQGELVDPVGPETGSNRVYRGGGWSSDARYCRSALRYGITPGNRIYYLGFRLAFSSVDQSGSESVP